MATGVSNLAGSVINLSALREHARRELVEVLDSVRGKKALVLDSKLIGGLGLVSEVTLLKEHGVENIYRLAGASLDIESKSIMFLIRPSVENVTKIAKELNMYKQKGARKDVSIFFVPRRTMICTRILEEEGVLDDVEIGEYQLDLIPFDVDVLSLELDQSYRDCFLDGDRTSLFYVARALMKLQALFGVIPNIKGKGVAAELVLEMITRMARENAAALSSGLDGAAAAAVAPEIDQLVLIDREVDMVTPMCTQLTYEGLIDEMFGINNALVELAPAITGAKGDKPVKVVLNSGDKLFAQVRDLNFSVLGPILNARAKKIEEYYKRKNQLDTLSDVKNFVADLGSYQAEHKSLVIHSSIAEAILPNQAFHKRLECEQTLVAGGGGSFVAEFIEEAINRQQPLVSVLRLLCLYSLTNNGLKTKQFEFFKKEILQTYGYSHMFTLNNLEKLGLFRPSTSRSVPWNSVRKSLRLIVEDIDEANPSDVAFVYSGYAPLSIRLVEHACGCSRQSGGGGFLGGGSGTSAALGGASGGAGGDGDDNNDDDDTSAVASSRQWRSIEDVMKLLPGPSFERAQQLPPGVANVRYGGGGGAGGAGAGGAGGAGGGARRRVVLVFFLGGVTFTEISALRFLSRTTGNDFIIATTKLVNGSTLLDTFTEKI